VVLKACFIHLLGKTARGMHVLTLYRYNVDYTQMRFVLDWIDTFLWSN